MRSIEIQDVIIQVNIDKLIFKNNYIAIDYIYNALVDSKINEFNLSVAVIRLTGECRELSSK